MRGNSAISGTIRLILVLSTATILSAVVSIIVVWSFQNNPLLFIIIEMAVVAYAMYILITTDLAGHDS
jgi:hypothetical protein